jgi:hypothetical protein
MSDVTVQVGDVIHVSVEDVAAKSPLLNLAQSEPDPPSISQLLAASRAAHARFHSAIGSVNKDGTVRDQPNDVIALAAIQDALAQRQAALAADPQRHDPAWAIDLRQNCGVTSDALMNFYADYLATD